MKFIKTFILALVLITATTSSIFAQSTVEQVSDSTETIIIKVKGADCSNDLKRISLNIEKEPGVSSSKIVKEGATAKFEVVYNPAIISKEEIYGAIEMTSGCSNPKSRPYSIKD